MGSGQDTGCPPDAPRPHPVEELLQQFIRDAESGAAPDAEGLGARLDPSARRQLGQLIDEYRRLSSLMDQSVAPEVGPSLRPGRLLAGRYRLIREIGRGGMGVVFEAGDVRLERRVAVKLLLESAKLNDETERLFLREAVLLANLKHPNLASVHELGRDGGIDFIVMDLVEGRDLAAVLSRVRAAAGAARHGRQLADAIALPVPPGGTTLIEDSWFRTVARLVLDVARTLEAAHAAQVIHRDLKPQNILLRGGGAPVILDFGLAGVRREGGDARTRGLFGTAAYLAPEQVSGGEMGAEPRSDVYQVGLILYELLTLQRAFGGDNVTDMIRRIGRGEFRRPRAIDRGIPFELEAICLRAIELRPAARYGSMAELGADLERWLGGRELPVAARGGALASAARSTRYLLRRRRVQAVAAGALIAGALGGWAAFRAIAPPAAVELRATRFRPATNEMQLVPAFDEVRADDILGVQVDAKEAQYIYALSVFGERDPPTWVNPLPVELASGAGADGERPDPWCQRVRAGRQQLICARIGPQNAGIPYEGLWVFATPEPQPRLAEWMDELQRRSEANRGAGVPFATAKALLLEGPPTTRGVAVATSAAERAALQGLLAQPGGQGEVDWPLQELMRYAVAFRVEREP